MSREAHHDLQSDSHIQCPVHLKKKEINKEEEDMRIDKKVQRDDKNV